MPAAMRQYRPAECAAAQGSEAPLSGRFGARSRREGRQHQLVIADATAKARERSRDAKRLWSAEIHLRLQVAHCPYTVMCVNRDDAQVVKDQEAGRVKRLLGAARM